MTDSELLTRWSIGMAAAIVVVLVVAALLLLIIVEARRILAAAVRCLVAVQKIGGNVEPLWELQTTNAVAEKLAGTAGSIEGKARLLADTLEAHQAAPSITRS